MTNNAKVFMTLGIDKSVVTVHLDALIEKGIIFLLIFTPLAIGTVQQWSISVMEMVSFIVFGVWLLKMALLREVIISKTPLIFFFLIFIFLAVLQIIPMPDSLIAYISPSSGRTYNSFIDNQADALRTISINPDATKQELFKFLSYAFVFLVIINHYKTKNQVNGLARTIIYMGCFLSVFAVAQKITWNGNLFWIYPLKENLHPVGPYINRNHFAGYMEMAIPIAMGFLLYNVSHIKNLSNMPLSRKITQLADNKELIPIALLFLSVVIMAGALFFSLSRGGIIGFIVSAVFFITITRTRRSLKNKTGILALLGLAIFFAVIIASWSSIEKRFEELREEENIKRLEVWEDAEGIIKDFPVFGSGLGTFKDIYMQYQTRTPRFMFDHAHNDYIEILTDTGFAGFLIVIGMAVMFFYTVIKAWRHRHNSFVKCIGAGGLSSCTAIIVHSFTDFNLHIPANAMLLTVIAAISYAAVFNISDRNNKHDSKNI